MNKKTFMAGIAIAGLLLSLVGMQFVEAQVSTQVLNPHTWGPYPQTSIGITLPANGAYCTNPVTLLFATSQPGNGQMDPDFVVVALMIDGGYVYKINVQSTETVVGIILVDVYSVTLPSLARGQHSVMVFLGNTNLGDSEYYIVAKASTDFTVLTAPVITSLSIQNTTYFTPDLPFVFNVDEPASWIAYSLDNQANVTMGGNATLTDLTEGTHTLVVYANDAFGNMGKSDVVFFNVSLPAPTPNPTPIPSPTSTQTPSPSPTQMPTLEPSITSKPIIGNDNTLVVLVIAIPILILTVGLGAYFRKRRK